MFATDGKEMTSPLHLHDLVAAPSYHAVMLVTVYHLSHRDACHAAALPGLRVRACTSFSGDCLHRCGMLRQVVWGDVLHTLLKENARNRALKVFLREFCPEQTLRKQMPANSTE